jgi:alpha-1,3-rhamnosyl/mannosyltransferase
MRILFNAYAAVSPPLTGVGHYARRLLQGLAAHRTELELLCFNDNRIIDLPNFSAPVPGGQTRSNMVRRLALSLAYRAPYARQLRTVLSGGLVQDRYRDAIYHEPNHILQPFRGRGVVTVHDISVLHYPEFHPQPRVIYFNRHLRETLARADRIITDSAFISRDLQRTLGIAMDRIRIVPLGVDAAFKPISDAAAAPVLARYGLTARGYLLAVGTREPRKNLERLLEAYLTLPDPLRARIPLALVGPPGWRIEKLEARLGTLEQSGQMRRLGYVADADRPALYAGATGLAYPSLYEGFGLPPLEAAACGIPVVTSRDSPMAEVLGETAVLIDPLDIDAIREGLVRLVDDTALAATARQKAAHWHARYSWEACVARTIAVYRELA